jgi:quinoprotein relay system zinc metallohydrolase 2
MKLRCRKGVLKRLGSSKRGAAALLAALLQTGALLLPGAGLAEPAYAGSPPADCAAPANVTQISSGAYVRQGAIALPSPANGGATANIGFIIGAASVAVIDTGGSLCDGLKLRKAIRQRTALPIEHVINTHGHPDHVFGNAAFADDPATIIGHQNLPAAIGERFEHYLQSYDRQVGSAAMKGTRLILPDTLVADRLSVDLGGRELVIAAYPAAHTNNDLTVFDRQSGTLWTGDLIFLDHVPVLDGSIKGWLAVTSELMQHEAVRIVPGHGPVTAQWPGAGEDQHRYLERLAADLRQAIRAGKGIGEAADQAVEGERVKWRLFDSYNRRNASAGYAELEWE